MMLAMRLQGIQRAELQDIWCCAFGAILMPSRAYVFWICLANNGAALQRLRYLTLWKHYKSAQRFTLPALRVPFVAPRPRAHKRSQTKRVCKPLKPFTYYRASAPASCHNSQLRTSTSAKTGVETDRQYQFVHTSSQIPSFSRLFSVPGVCVWVVDSRIASVLAVTNRHNYQGLITGAERHVCC